MSTSAIEAQGLTKRYRDKLAVDDLTFDVGSGRVTGFLGPNGGNAIAHTPPGSPIGIHVGTVGGRAVLEISDHGPGLTPEQAARVFDRFYRADSSRSRSTGGAGLGLSIALSLVAAHGGVLELETAMGEGATFRLALVTLPGSA